MLLKTKITYNEKCCGWVTNINVVEILMQKDSRPVSVSECVAMFQFFLQESLATPCQSGHYVIILQYMACTQRNGIPTHQSKH